jgi:hypothetical protein
LDPITQGWGTVGYNEIYYYDGAIHYEYESHRDSLMPFNKDLKVDVNVPFTYITDDGDEELWDGRFQIKFKYLVVETFHKDDDESTRIRGRPEHIPVTEPKVRCRDQLINLPAITQRALAPSSANYIATVLEVVANKMISVMRAEDWPVRSIEMSIKRCIFGVLARYAISNAQMSQPTTLPVPMLQPNEILGALMPLTHPLIAERLSISLMAVLEYLATEIMEPLSNQPEPITVDVIRKSIAADADMQDTINPESFMSVPTRSYHIT